MIELKLPLHQSTFDKEYGRVDIAPRIMGQGDYDGEFGYLLAYIPTQDKYVAEWDDGNREAGLSFDDFVVISNVTLTK